MYVPVTLGQPASALAPIEIASAAALAGPTPTRTFMEVRGSRLNVLAGNLRSHKTNPAPMSKMMTIPITSIPLGSSRSSITLLSNPLSGMSSCPATPGRSDGPIGSGYARPPSLLLARVFQ